MALLHALPNATRADGSRQHRRPSQSATEQAAKHVSIASVLMAQIPSNRGCVSAMPFFRLGAKSAAATRSTQPLLCQLIIELLEHVGPFGDLRIDQQLHLLPELRENIAIGNICRRSFLTRGGNLSSAGRSSWCRTPRSRRPLTNGAASLRNPVGRCPSRACP